MHKVLNYLKEKDFEGVSEGLVRCVYYKTFLLIMKAEILGETNYYGLEDHINLPEYMKQGLRNEALEMIQFDTAYEFMKTMCEHDVPCHLAKTKGDVFRGKCKEGEKIVDAKFLRIRDFEDDVSEMDAKVQFKNSSSLLNELLLILLKFFPWFPTFHNLPPYWPGIRILVFYACSIVCLYLVVETCHKVCPFCKCRCKRFLHIFSSTLFVTKTTSSAYFCQTYQAIVNGHQTILINQSNNILNQYINKCSFTWMVLL